jgi:hypothetical protein
VVEVSASRLDCDVVGRQPNVRVGAAVVLLDVGLEVKDRMAYFWILGLK